MTDLILIVVAAFFAGILAVTFYGIWRETRNDDEDL